MSCSGEIKSIVIIKNTDWIWKFGVPVKMKRKYGKFDRKLYKIK